MRDGINWEYGVDVEPVAGDLLRQVVGERKTWLQEMPHYSQRLIIPPEPGTDEYRVTERDARHLIRRLMSWGLEGENRMPTGWSVVRDPVTQNVYLVILAEETGLIG